MKKLIFMGILGLFTLGSCNNKNTQEHEEHNHGSATHQHEHHQHETNEHQHNEHEEHSHSHKENERSEGHGDEIILPKNKAEAAGVKVSTVEPLPFHQVIKAGGQILTAQGEESVVVATVAGIVSFRSRLTEGMNVSNRMPLVSIASHNIVEGDPVQRARVAYETTRKEYERMKELVQKQIVSEKEFAQAKQEYENARISYEALAKNHSATGQNIVSPINGYVKGVFVKEGDYVTVGQPLLSVTRNRKLYLRAEVSEKYYSSLRNIRSANFRTPYDNKVYELDELNGRLLSFGKAAGENSFYVPVTFEFDNRGDIIAGAYVEVFLTTIPTENVVTLPCTALTEEQGLFFVYLQVDEEGYMKQEVKLGANDGKRIEILSGVQPGDRVVTEGATQVRLASASNAIPAHSHEH